jgi:GT2 family glycosyltransferase
MSAASSMSLGKEKVSVIVVNYNAGSLLTECLGSVLPQVDEVIVIDNASSDSSIVDCVQNFGEETRLKIIQNDVNIGFAAACNIGLSYASGNCILFLNPDCRLESDTISVLLGELLADDSIGMAGGFLMNADGTEQAGGRRAVPTPWRTFVRAFGLSRFSHRWPRLFSDFNLHKQPLPEQPMEVEAISGACMMVKREAIDDIGLWDEDYFLHCEDLDWCMRFGQKGWKIFFVPDAKIVHLFFVPDAKIVHYQGACSRSRPVFVEWHKHKGMMHFYGKFFKHQYPGPLMWLVGMAVWMRFSLIAGYYTFQKIRVFFRFDND